MCYPALPICSHKNKLTMPEFHIDVATADGAMECFAVHPEGAGPFPAVIFYMDVPGIREELRDMCRRIAGEGYFALLPDMYYRDGKVRFDLAKGEEELQRMFAQGQKLTIDGIMDDTRGMLDYLEANSLVTGPVGCIGHCMSGQYVVAAAGTFPEQIGAVASLYGVRIVTDQPNSPHKLADQIKAELYLGFAEHDPFVEDFVIPDLREALDNAGVTYNLTVHEGTDHGFCFPQRPSYHEQAAETAWGIIFDMFERKLKV